MSKKLIVKLILCVVINFCTNTFGSEVATVRVDSNANIFFSYLKNGTYQCMAKNKTWELPPKNSMGDYDKHRFNGYKLTPCTLHIIDNQNIEILADATKYHINSSVYVKGLLEDEFDANVSNQLIVELYFWKDGQFCHINLKVINLIKPEQKGNSQKEQILPAQAIFLKESNQKQKLVSFFSDQQMPEKINTVAGMCALKVTSKNCNNLIHPCDINGHSIDLAIPIEDLSTDKVKNIIEAINDNQKIFAFISDSLYRILYVYENDRLVVSVQQSNKKVNSTTPGNNSIPLIIGGMVLFVTIVASIMYYKNPDKITDFYTTHLAPFIKLIAQKTS